MAQEFRDRVDVTNGDEGTTLTLQGNRGAVYAGGEGTNGRLGLRDGSDVERVTLDAGGRLVVRDSSAETLFEIDTDEGSLIYHDAEGRRVLRFLSGRGTVELGSRGKAGRLSVVDGEGGTVIEQDAAEARLRVGGAGRGGEVELTDSEDRSTVTIEGDSATLKLGAEGQPGDLKVLKADGGLLFQASASFATLRGSLIVGARESRGEIAVMDPMGRPAVHVDGGTAKLQLGNLGNAGDVAVLDNEARPVLEFDGLTSTLEVGGGENPGYVVLRNTGGTETVRLSGKEAALFLGGSGRDGEILLLDSAGKSALWVDGANSCVKVGTGDTEVVLDGKEGAIKLGGADCAENFESIDPDALEPGTVVVIAGEAALARSTRPYDRRVAGVVSGAEGARPGILLNEGSPRANVPVALNGRVYCKADAEAAPIEIGDLLTTSGRAGHAMKASDRERTHGAILGKALGDLESGVGLIPVLVSLI